TLTRMERDCKTEVPGQSKRARIWEVFRLRTLEPIFEGGPRTDYESMVASLGIASPAEAQNILATAKRIFKRHLAAVINEYEQSGPAAKRELEDIKQFLARMSG